ncbi:unnamed protein product [Pleuronectes platessa]|uniref:Uncharacterized protein n=1 Tax=Pleuronectes platessa TaxID=8262 RepID=A0A9N7V3Z5_PLEPL|nr:unnamed protein product [Pleuronectes platessa]
MERLTDARSVFLTSSRFHSKGRPYPFTSGEVDSAVLATVDGAPGNMCSSRVPPSLKQSHVWVHRGGGGRRWLRGAQLSCAAGGRSVSSSNERFRSARMYLYAAARGRTGRLTDPWTSSISIRHRHLLSPAAAQF